MTNEPSAIRTTCGLLLSATGWPVRFSTPRSSLRHLAWKCRLSSPATPNAPRRRARAYEGVEVFADVDSLMARPATSISSSWRLPTAMHAPTALAAIDAGKAVVIDKPFAVSVGEGESLIDAADFPRRPAQCLSKSSMGRRFPDVAPAARRGCSGRGHQIRVEVRALAAGCGYRLARERFTVGRRGVAV